MLRTALLVFAGVVALAGIVLLGAGKLIGGAYALGLGVLIVIGTVFERRYRANDDTLGAGWEPTDERFVDPQTGKTVRVFYHSQSGERRYVSDSEPSGSSTRAGS
jgi:hypothetical protein